MLGKVDLVAEASTRGDKIAWGLVMVHEDLPPEPDERVVEISQFDEAFWRAEARLVALERLKCGVTTGVSYLGGGDSIMRTDDPRYGLAHAEGVDEIGIRAEIAVGPNRPPFPKT